MSLISSWGLSQKSTVVASGPDKYQPSQNSANGLMHRRFMALSVTEEGLDKQIEPFWMV